MLRGNAVCAALAVSALLGWGEEFERTLKVSGPAMLDIRTEAGGIHVTPGRTGVVVVRATLKPQAEALAPDDVQRRIRELERNPPVEQSGNTIRVGHVDASMLKGLVMRLDIAVPPESQLRARASSGGVHVSGLRGLADLSAGSGGVEAFDMAGEVRVESQSGGVEVSQTAAAPVQIRARSGGVKVKLAGGAGYDVNATVESGGMRAQGVQGTLSKREARGKLRGGGPTVEIRAGSGGVTIE
jgi:hypothetical protein